METNNTSLKIFISTAGMIIVVELLIGQMALAINVSQPLIMVGFARILEILFMWVLVYYFTKDFSIVGLAADTLLSGVKSGVVWSGGFGIVALVMGISLYFAGFNPIRLVASSLPKDTTGLILLFVMGGILGPLAEELFFRGICYGYFRRWGIVSAIIVTTGIFVVAHAVKNVVPVPQIVGGIVFALSYEYSKSLITPIIIHVSGNLAIFTISLCV